MDMKAKLSTLWIVVLFNIIFLEFHKFLQPGFLQEVMTGTVNGTQLTQGVLLMGAIVLEIPTAMLLLSRVLKYRVNRWANIIAGAITIAFILGNRQPGIDEIFFVAIEVVALLLIVWYAWKWPKLAAKD